MLRSVLDHRRHRAADRRPLVATILVAATATGAAALVARRRGRPRPTAQPTPTVPGPPSESPVAKAVEETWSCECGQAYRVQGEDRHRIYWLADASVSDPVLSSDCPNCERPLPREHGDASGVPSA